MKFLTKNADYAIRSLLVMGTDKNKYFSAKEISTAQEIPYQFLRRILQSLIKHNILISKEGINGGFKLAKLANDIKVLDIIEVFQDKVELSDCMFRKKICSNRSTCVLRHELLRIGQIVNSEFSKLSIQNLIDKLSNQEKK